MTPDEHAARLEDVRFMADMGETSEGAAARLGITPGGLAHWCRRQGHAELWERLLNNGRAAA